MQNIAARIVSRCPKYCHITPVLKSLHWLPVKARIHFKILLLMFKAVNGLAPHYLCEMVFDYVVDYSGVVVSMMDLQACDPGSIPGMPDTHKGVSYYA